MTKFVPLLGNAQRLDGGALFGNVPKAMWQNWVDVDDNNAVHLVTRALLIQEENRNVLLETGIGAFFEPKLKQRFGVIQTEHVLLDSLAQVGLSHADIDIVVLSHLHFDHAGGLLSAWQPDISPQLLFPNAQFVTSEIAYHRARQPHPRDKASFIPQLPALLETSGRLHLVQGRKDELMGSAYRFHYSDGHTPGLLMTEIKFADAGHVLFVSDLIPGSPWVHIPVTMGYDRYPELVINEKTAILEYALDNQIELFFTHDPNIAQAAITKDARGRFQALSFENNAAV